MNGDVFVDTNIFLYALTIPESPSSSELAKHEKALEFFKTTILDADSLVTSVQIINEVHFNLIRKFHIDDLVAFELVRTRIVNNFEVLPVSIAAWYKSVELRSRYSLSYWDSIMVSSALEKACSFLVTEDLQDGLVIDKKLCIYNPLA
jgi:predicted nucleic acid-binding protein